MPSAMNKLRSKSLAQREQAANMLKEQLDCGGPSAAERTAIVQGLMELIERESNDGCRATALMALCSCPRDVPMDRIVEMLSDFDHLSLIEALCLIGESGDKHHTALVEPYLNDADLDIRIAAEEAYAVLRD